MDRTFEDIRAMLAGHGCDRVLIKYLAPNDNSKNQVYFGPGFQAVNLLPHGPAQPDGKRFKASVDFVWMQADGHLFPAPSAQLILYPQYPEVRFSGFLLGCQSAPSGVMTSRDEGRVLILGLGSGDRIIGTAVGPESRTARHLEESPMLRSAVEVGVFLQTPISTSVSNTTEAVLRALGEIHQMGWIPGQRLGKNGVRVPTNAPNACGYTLEAMLGVEANSTAGPDFLGWEVKALTTKTLGSVPTSKRLTLMTPEPRGGVYSDDGVLDFVRRYGYPDTNGVADRLNFGGQFRYGQRAKTTGLTLTMDGYESDETGLRGRIVDPSGGISLRDDEDNVAARWAFSDLIDHWNRKHALAVYVPAAVRITDHRSFHFDRNVFLGQQTDFLRFLGAIRMGLILYDPGIKVVSNSKPQPRIKRRSQFRVSFRDLHHLYGRFRASSVYLGTRASQTREWNP